METVIVPIERGAKSHYVLGKDPYFYLPNYDIDTTRKSQSVNILTFAKPASVPLPPDKKSENPHGTASLVQPSPSELISSEALRLKAKKGISLLIPRKNPKPGGYILYGHLDTHRHFTIYLPNPSPGALLIRDMYQNENFGETNMVHLWGNQEAKLDPILFFLTGEPLLEVDLTLNL